MKPRAWVVVPNHGATTPYSTMIEPGPEVLKLAQVFPLTCELDARLQHALTAWREKRNTETGGKDA